jgi:hypothetical protein
VFSECPKLLWIRAWRTRKRKRRKRMLDALLEKRENEGIFRSELDKVDHVSLGSVLSLDVRSLGRPRACFP